MTPKDLLNIVLKVLGIYFIKELVLSVTNLLSAIYYVMYSGTLSMGIWTLISTLIVMALYAELCYLLIFKTTSLIKDLKLTDGFEDETIAIKIHRSTMLSIAVIVIGGVLFVQELPTFLAYLSKFLLDRNNRYEERGTYNVYTIIAGIKVVVALFLMVGQRQIVNLIEKQRKN